MASARIEALFKEHFPIFVASRFIPLIPGSIFETMGAVLVALFVVIIVTRPHLGLSLPELAAMVVLMRRLLPTVSGINQSLIQLNYRARMVEVADETLNKMPLEKMGGIKLLSTQSISSIELEKVTFSYESRKETRVLDEVSLRLKRGRVTALVGQTGSGKSTIADLIMRLYQQDKGQILVDNINLSEIDLLTWRRRIGYVSQDPYLFHTTLHNNITLWDDSVDKNQLDLAVRIAQLDTFLKELPEGYETIVGDRGLTLSGGQRQRVAIARAVLHNPDVLVFDEATSALDNLTEKEVHVAIDKLRTDAVLLVIAHRLSTVRDADNVIVLDKGRIVEQGTPADLLKSKGQFWHLYHKDDER
jgi:ABC-type multidrug transport system fused ATPase/permease subunit